MAAMNDRLADKPESHLVEDEIHDKGDDQRRGETADQVKVAHQDQVADCAHGAETGALGQEPDDRPDAEVQISSGAWIEPGPLALKKIGPSLVKVGWKMRSNSRLTTIRGMIQAAAV